MASDISSDDAGKITDEAKTWAGTPYRMIGSASVKGRGGDCSGSTWSIYSTAGFRYDYQSTSTFIQYVSQKRKFRELAASEKWQEGDILYWPNHMAIYSAFGKDPNDGLTDRINKQGLHWVQHNNMWTATHPGGPLYQSGNSGFFKAGVKPRVFRYQK